MSHRRYMRYLYPYECDRKGLSTPGELQAAIDGNRREGRRSSYGQFDQSMQGQLQQLVIITFWLSIRGPNLMSFCSYWFSNRFRDLQYRADFSKCHHYRWLHTERNKMPIIAWWAVRQLAKCRTWSHMKSNNEWWNTSNYYKIPKKQQHHHVSRLLPLYSQANSHGHF